MPRDPENSAQQQAQIFPTGATRSDDSQKPDYEGYLSPLVLQRFGVYMFSHQYEGQRTSDNWQKGIPRDKYIKSAWRHFLTWWLVHRNGGDPEDALCGLFFNVQGYLHEYLKDRAQVVSTSNPSLRA